MKRVLTLGILYSTSIFFTIQFFLYVSEGGSVNFVLNLLLGITIPILVYAIARILVSKKEFFIGMAVALTVVCVAIGFMVVILLKKEPYVFFYVWFLMLGLLCVIFSDRTAYLEIKQGAFPQKLLKTVIAAIIYSVIGLIWSSVVFSICDDSLIYQILVVWVVVCYFLMKLYAGDKCLFIFLSFVCTMTCPIIVLYLLKTLTFGALFIVLYYLIGIFLDFVIYRIYLTVKRIVLKTASQACKQGDL